MPNISIDKGVIFVIMFLLIETKVFFMTADDNIKEIVEIISKLSQSEILEFLNEILTNGEINILSKRWRILKMLKNQIPQRQIAQKLNVSLCKITRGAKILKNENAVVNKIYKEKIYDFEQYNE